MYLPHLTNPQLTNRNSSPSSIRSSRSPPAAACAPFPFSFVSSFFVFSRVGDSVLAQTEFLIVHSLNFRNLSLRNGLGTTGMRQLNHSRRMITEHSATRRHLFIWNTSVQVPRSWIWKCFIVCKAAVCHSQHVPTGPQDILPQDATNVLIEYYATTDASACLHGTKTTLHFPPISKSDVLDNLAYIDSGNTCCGSKRMAYFIIRASVYCKAIVVGYNDDSAKPYKGRMTICSPSDTSHFLRVWAQFILSVLWITELILLHHSSACWYNRMLWSWHPQARHSLVTSNQSDLGWMWALKWVQRSQCRSHSRAMDTNAYEMRILKWALLGSAICDGSIQASIVGWILVIEKPSQVSGFKRSWNKVSHIHSSAAFRKEIIKETLSTADSCLKWEANHQRDDDLRLSNIKWS